MYSTGCPSSSGSCSVLVPWSGGVSWVLLRLPPRSLPSHPGHQRLQFTPIIGTGVTLCSFCSYIHNPGPCILGGWCGMAFRCRKDCCPGLFLTHSTLVSKLFFLAVQGSGALLSSNLEGALYKSP